MAVSVFFLDPDLWWTKIEAGRGLARVDSERSAVREKVGNKLI